MNALFREIIEAEILRVVSIKEHNIPAEERASVCNAIFVDFNNRMDVITKRVLVLPSNIMVVTQVLDSQRWVLDVALMLSKSLEAVGGKGSTYGDVVKKPLHGLRCQYLYTTGYMLVGVIIEDENTEHNIVDSFNKNEAICIKYI